jgi:hypothetical protein
MLRRQRCVHVQAGHGAGARQPSERRRIGQLKRMTGAGHCRDTSGR